MKKAIQSILGLSLLLTSAMLAGAVTNETPRLISAGLRQTNGPLNTMF